MTIKLFSIVCSFPLGCAASIVVYYGRVLIQSYFSWLLLSGSMKSAWGLWKRHCRLPSAVSERTTVSRTADQMWSLRCPGQLAALRWTSHVGGVLWLEKKPWEARRLNSTWRSSCHHDEPTTVEAEDGDLVAESSEILNVNTVAHCSSSSCTHMFNCWVTW